MANIVPGALWRPIDVGARVKRKKGRGLIGHVAVSNQTLLVPGPLATRASDWTFYLPKEPYPSGERFAQLIDLDLQCWSSAAGNATCPAFESQGGMGTSAQVNAEPWTANQVESAAIILAHLNRTEGVPLKDMGNSLAASKGMAVHRYGISPWRVAGGEVWSSSNGKLCPGDAKVRQIPAIVARAQQLVNGEDDMPTAHELTDYFLNYPAYVGGPTVSEVYRDVYKWLRGSDKELDTLTVLYRQHEQLLAAKGATGPAVNVDASTVAGALASNPDFLAAIAKAVADENARRQES